VGIRWFYNKAIKEHLTNCRISICWTPTPATEVSEQSYYNQSVVVPEGPWANPRKAARKSPLSHRFGAVVRPIALYVAGPAIIATALAKNSSALRIGSSSLT